MSTMSASTNRSAVRLYRSILHLHRTVLPSQHRALGDKYVRAEFRAHASAKPDHVPPFMRAWETYRERLQAHTSEFGRELREDEHKSLTPEQKERLERLRGQAAQQDK